MQYTEEDNNFQAKLLISTIKQLLLIKKSTFLRFLAHDDQPQSIFINPHIH